MTFSCCLTGSTGLTISCGEVLLEAGHDIVTTVSPSRRVRGWARQRGILTADRFAPKADGAPRFDYLFSVVNGTVLDAHTLALARFGAINYHNGPLPSYAGAHAASWAILNGEASHGVSWHLMVERIDAGPILKQRLFRVPHGVDAAEVNAICHRLGTEAFVELVDELSSGRARAVDQDLASRTYFGLHAKQRSGGLVRWDESASAIARLVRAHQVGDVVNMFGTAKVDLGSLIAVVGDVSIETSRVPHAPGTVVEVVDDRIRVSTRTDDVSLRILSDLDGSLSARDLVLAAHLRLGAVLPLPDAGDGRALAAGLAATSRHEAFCARVIAEADPTPLPGAAGPPIGHLCAEVATALDPRSSAVAERDTIAAAATVLLIREWTGRANVVVSCDRPSSDDRPGRFFRAGLPLTISSDGTPLDVRSRVAKELAAVAGRDTYARDIVRRQKLGAPEVPFAVGRRDAYVRDALEERHPDPDRAQLRVSIEADGSLHMCSTGGRDWRALSSEQLALAADRLSSLTGQLVRSAPAPTAGGQCMASEAGAASG
ncbi:MAG: hypothetical protein GY716_06925 [bacterium]|nr:hypothetical protein [bacterium]